MLFLAVILVSQLAAGVPSGTQLQLGEGGTLSRAHFISTPPTPQGHLAQLRDSTIELLWNLFYPASGTTRRQKPVSVEIAPPPHRGQYADQVVLRFNISTEVEIASLVEAANLLFLDIWAFSDHWVDIRLEQDVVPSLLGLLPASLQSSAVPLMTGLELVRAVADTYPSSTRARGPNAPIIRHSLFTSSSSSASPPSSKGATNVFFDDYRSLTVITHWLRLLESLFSSHARIITVGQTSSGQPIRALRVGNHPTLPTTTSSPRKTILITAGSHAREWVSTSTVNYLAYSLVTAYGRSKTATRLLSEFDWIFVPTLNPDGYEYTWNADRLWRKNRQPTPLRFCRGVDLDRTWPYKWDGADANTSTTGDSATGNPCSESYAGTAPLDAAESRTFAAWVHDQVESGNATFVALLDLHSYSEQILYPYSHSCATTPPNLEDLAELGQGLAKAIRGRGHENYHVLSACEGNVAARFEDGGSGGSMLDWFYHDMGVKRSFQVKLRDKGGYGFLLPPEYIVPTGVEMLRAVEYLGRTLSDTGPWEVEEWEMDNLFADAELRGPGQEQRPLA